MTTWHEFVTARREIYPDILADHKAGMGGTELSQKYGISRQRIYRILKKLSLPATPHKGNGRSSKSGQSKRVKREKKGKNGSGTGKTGRRRGAAT